MYREAMTQSDRVADIVKNLLEFSRASHPRLEEASIEEIVHKTARLVRNEMRHSRIKFSLEVKDRLPPLQVDKGGLQQVLLNLFLNSMQAMPNGGEITVVIRLTEAMAGELKDRGINVNCILPSIIDTERNRQDMPDADFSLWVRPEAMAKVVGFLASEAAAPIHGAALPVSGLS